MQTLKVFDAHVHFYDYTENRYAIFEEIDVNFVAFVGDYSALPRVYTPQEYLKDSSRYQVAGVAWHEFISSDPIKEAQWAQKRIPQSPIKQAIVALVDFLDPSLEEKLEAYDSLPNVTAVREHMVWDPHNPQKRFAKRPDLLTDPDWQKRLHLLDRYSFKCGLEVFSSQLPDLAQVIQQFPQIDFSLALMGWPIDLTDTGHRQWAKEMAILSQCENICVTISGIECIFGMQWTVEQIRPWILEVIERFGPKRCMFGSHMPIAKLSRSFNELYQAYEEVVANFSSEDKEQLFYYVAAEWYNTR